MVEPTGDPDKPDLPNPLTQVIIAVLVLFAILGFFVPAWWVIAIALGALAWRTTRGSWR